MPLSTAYLQWFLSSSLIFLSNGEHKQFPFILNLQTLQPPAPTTVEIISLYICLFIKSLQRGFIHKFPINIHTVLSPWFGNEPFRCLLSSHWTLSQLWFSLSGSVAERAPPSLSWSPSWMTKRENSNSPPAGPKQSSDSQSLKTEKGPWISCNALDETWQVATEDRQSLIPPTLSSLSLLPQPRPNPQASTVCYFSWGAARNGGFLLHWFYLIFFLTQSSIVNIFLSTGKSRT